MTADARCDLTDLLVEQCQHCRPKGRTIEAGLHSTCPTCSTPVVPGDRIRETPTGQWEHSWHR